MMLQVGWYAGQGKRGGSLEQPRNNAMPMGVRCLGQHTLYIRTDAWTYPAMPTDWGYVSAARSPSQYAGVTLSIPSLVPIKMSVG